MDDLISRQEAIGAINKIFPADPMRDDYTQGITCGAALANIYVAQLPSAQPEPCGDVVSINAIVQKLNEMDRYVSTELRLCDTDKKFPQNEVFIVDDVYEEIVEQLPSAQPKKRTETHGVCLDAIDRQAAIDICNNAIDLWQGQLGEGIVIAVRKKIEELPSAQPDSKELSFTQKALDTISRQAAIDALENTKEVAR